MSTRVPTMTTTPNEAAASAAGTSQRSPQALAPLEQDARVPDAFSADVAAAVVDDAAAPPNAAGHASEAHTAAIAPHGDAHHHGAMPSLSQNDDGAAAAAPVSDPVPSADLLERVELLFFSRSKEEAAAGKVRDPATAAAIYDMAVRIASSSAKAAVRAAAAHGGQTIPTDVLRALAQLPRDPRANDKAAAAGHFATISIPQGPAAGHTVVLNDRQVAAIRAARAPPAVKADIEAEVDALFSGAGSPRLDSPSTATERRTKGCRARLPTSTSPQVMEGAGGTAESSMSRLNFDVTQRILEFIGLDDRVSISAVFGVRLTSRAWHEAVANYAAAELAYNDRYSRSDLEMDEDKFPLYGRLPYGHEGDDADPRAEDEVGKPLRGLDLVFNASVSSRVPVHTLLLVLARGCNGAHDRMLRRISTLRVCFVDAADTRAFTVLLSALSRDGGSAPPMLSAVRRLVVEHRGDSGADVSCLLDALHSAEQLRAVTLIQAPSAINVTTLLRRCPRLRFLNVAESTSIAIPSGGPVSSQLEHLHIGVSAVFDRRAVGALLRMCPALRRLKVNATEVAPARALRVLTDVVEAARQSCLQALDLVDVLAHGWPVDVQQVAKQLVEQSPVPGLRRLAVCSYTDFDNVLPVGGSAVVHRGCHSMQVHDDDEAWRAWRAALPEYTALKRVKLHPDAHLTVADFDAIAGCSAPLRELVMVDGNRSPQPELIAAANRVVAAHASTLELLDIGIPVGMDVLARCTALVNIPGVLYYARGNGWGMARGPAVLACFKADPSATFPRLRELDVGGLLRAAGGDAGLVERFIAQQGAVPGALSTPREPVRVLTLSGGVSPALMVAAARCCPKTVSLKVPGDIPAVTFRALLRLLPELEELALWHPCPNHFGPLVVVLAEPWVPQLARVYAWDDERFRKACATVRQRDEARRQSGT